MAPVEVFFEVTEREIFSSINVDWLLFRHRMEQTNPIVVQDYLSRRRLDYRHVCVLHS